MDRIKAFQIIISLMTLAIIFRLVYWQFFAQIAEGASILGENEIPAARGEIFTSDNFPLVTNQEAFLIYGKPHELAQKPEEVAKILAPELAWEKYATASGQLSNEEEDRKKEEIAKNEESIAQKLKSKNLFWVLLGRKIPKNIRERIESTKIPGLGFEKDEKRFYPEASMSAQILGFVGSDKFGNDTGYFGLEGYYDRLLRGKPGKAGLEKDALGFPILVGIYKPSAPKEGSSLFLSIDRSIQFIVEEKLKQAVQKYGAREGTIIVQNPQTGEIIAMASYPSYSPNLWQEYDQKLYKNPAVADTYEPGSTFKIVSMAAAVDLSLVTPSTKCDICSGPRQIGGFEISTWNKKYYPDSTMTEVIQHSDNIGMTFVSDKLGTDKFYDYIRKFGFGQKTGIDLQDEATGTIRDKEEWRPIDLTTASFGQGLAVTPIQMVQAIGAIANKGKLITPRLVKTIKDGNRIEETKPDQIRQVVSSKTASQVTEMMVNAVQKGESRVFAPNGYRIAGKTGTAQIPVAGHYDPNKTIASFIGFAPADKPKFVMLVRFIEPTSSVFGSETAAPTFFDIAKELFNYYGIPPQE